MIHLSTTGRSISQCERIVEMKPSKLKRRWCRRLTHGHSNKFQRWMEHKCPLVALHGNLYYRVTYRDTICYFPLPFDRILL